VFRVIHVQDLDGPLDDAPIAVLTVVLDASVDQPRAVSATLIFPRGRAPRRVDRSAADPSLWVATD
jgi:hypothetical protein